ncbi:FCD domain-containing protein [Streptomyces violascens]|uniref:FCD domain-containing protein n=1 Tax=Streptomyces violascens TaxID=67381 RepID=UPI00366A0D75
MPSRLEGEAEANAAARLRPEDIAAMRSALEAQRVSSAAADAQEVIAANRRFHFALLDRCDNEWLLRFVTQLWEALEPHRALSYRRAAAAGDRHAPRRSSPSTRSSSTPWKAAGPLTRWT